MMWVAKFDVATITKGTPVSINATTMQPFSLVTKRPLFGEYPTLRKYRGTNVSVHLFKGRDGTAVRISQIDTN